MAEQQENPDELDGITDEDAKRLLDKPDDKPDAGSKNEDPDPDGADQLGDAGKKALDAIKEQRRAAREERDKAKADLAAAQKALSKYSDRDKSETQRLTEERDAAKAELAKATSAIKRRELAEEHAPEHATAAQIRAVAKRLSGDTDDELKADAKELYALIAPEPAKPPVSGKPRERLRGGGDPTDEPDEMDPKKLALRIGRPR
jgi:hypothetical protein